MPFAFSYGESTLAPTELLTGCDVCGYSILTSINSRASPLPGRAKFLQAPVTFLASETGRIADLAAGSPTFFGRAGFCAPRMAFLEIGFNAAPASVEPGLWVVPGLGYTEASKPRFLQSKYIFVAGGLVENARPAGRPRGDREELFAACGESIANLRRAGPRTMRRALDL